MTGAALSLLPPTARLRAYAGDDSTVSFRFTTNGAGFDVSGTYLAQIRAQPESATVVGSFEVDDSRAPEGILGLLLRQSLAATMPTSTTMVWDLEWTNPDGAKRTLVRGQLVLEPDVSR